MNGEPGLCKCGHYFYVHTARGCLCWERRARQPFRLLRGFYIRVTRLCPCKVTGPRGTAEEREID